MFEFKVSYYEKSKLKGKRSFPVNDSCYEDVLFCLVLDTIHLRATRGVNYEWPLLNNSVFIQRINMNSLICEYDVQIHHYRDWNKLLANYRVEIHCETPPKTKQEEEMLFEHYREIDRKYEPPNPIKSKQFPSWLENEANPIKWFLMELNRLGSLKALKKTMSSSTYYRKLRVCEEKGYIINGKLVKRIWVSKTLRK